MQNLLIETTVKVLQDTYGVKVLSQVGPHKKVGDIDCFLIAADEKAVRKFLRETGFVIYENPRRGILASQFINGQYYLIDIALSCDLFLDLHPNAFFTHKFYNEVWKDHNLEKFFRYVLPLRPQYKYTSFIKNHFSQYGNFLYDGTYLNHTPFRQGIRVEQVVAAMQKKPGALWRTFKPSALLQFFIKLVCIRLQKINSGKIIAVVGADGAGKSTVIADVGYALGLSRPLKTQYMGDYSFTLQPFYIWLHKQHIVIARLTYPFFYIENCFRYIKIRWWKLCGYAILTDRWPGLNRHLRKPGFLLRLNDLMYKFYPDADTYIFVSGPPAVVHARRDELTTEEIEILQKHMRQRLAKKSDWYEAVNEDLDECLNCVLRLVIQ